MEKVAYFILIICGILSQGIANVSEENNVAAEKSSDLLIRRKRIVGSASRTLNSNRFIVSVLFNGNYHCPATLLTADTVISSAACFIHLDSRYLKIATRSIGGDQLHEIVRLIYLDPSYSPTRPTVNNLVLVRFAQPVHFQTSYNRPIHIYSRNLATDHMMSRVLNWDVPIEVRGRRIPASNFQGLSVVVVSIEYCQTQYPGLIGPGNICSIGANPGAHCEMRDTGAPLVLNNELLGIFVYRGNFHPTIPDVYMNLLDEDIRRWIHEHVPSLGLL